MLLAFRNPSRQGDGGREDRVAPATTSPAQPNPLLHVCAMRMHPARPPFPPNTPPSSHLTRGNDDNSAPRPVSTPPSSSCLSTPQPHPTNPDKSAKLAHSLTTTTSQTTRQTKPRNQEIKENNIPQPSSSPTPPPLALPHSCSQPHTPRDDSSRGTPSPPPVPRPSTPTPAPRPATSSRTSRGRSGTRC